MNGRVLSIAGSDPSGGAGIQADIKTITALKGYAAAVITALTVQNTNGVRAIEMVPGHLVGAQIDAVLSDIGADAIKIGMIGTQENGAAILATLKDVGVFEKNIPIVLDPVLAATSGDALARDGLIDVLRDELLPAASLITPNIPEAVLLLGAPIDGAAAQAEATVALYERFECNVLLKGGHGTGDRCLDILCVGGEIIEFSHRKQQTRSTHGTGCTLASAIATGLAQKLDLQAATVRAIQYVQAAIKTAPGLGAGNGPLNHLAKF